MTSTDAPPRASEGDQKCRLQQPVLLREADRSALTAHLAQVLAGWCGGATVRQTRRALVKALELLDDDDA